MVDLEEEIPPTNQQNERMNNITVRWNSSSEVLSLLEHKEGYFIEIRYDSSKVGRSKTNYKQYLIVYCRAKESSTIMVKSVWCLTIQKYPTLQNMFML